MFFPKIEAVHDGDCERTIRAIIENAGIGKVADEVSASTIKGAARIRAGIA